MSYIMSRSDIFASKYSKGPYKILRQFARTLFERVEWVGGAAESKKLSDDKNVL